VNARLVCDSEDVGWAVLTTPALVLLDDVVRVDVQTLERVDNDNKEPRVRLRACVRVCVRATIRGARGAW
jgi:hypothetical protein